MHRSDSDVAVEAGAGLLTRGIRCRTGSQSQVGSIRRTALTPRSAHAQVHLFDIDIPGGVTFKESETLTAGQAGTVVDTDAGRLGIGICYDIRFPELALMYAQRGAQLLVYPGALPPQLWRGVTTPAVHGCPGSPPHGRVSPEQSCRW